VKKTRELDQGPNAGNNNISTENPTSKAAHSLMKLMMTNKGVRGKGADASPICSASLRRPGSIFRSLSCQHFRKMY